MFALSKAQVSDLNYMIKNTYEARDVDYLLQFPDHIRLMIVVGFLKITKKMNSVDLELNAQIEYFLGMMGVN